MADPCGQQYAVITHVLLLVEDLILCGLVLRPAMGAAAWPWICAHQVSCLLTAWAHLASMLTDPGAVPLGPGGDAASVGLAGLEEKLVEPDASSPVRGCRHCKVRKPPRAHHCSTCRRCILKMDHHCMWLNNCVGAHNQKHFLLFLSYLALHAAGSAASVTASLVAWLGRPTQPGQGDPGSGKTETEATDVWFCWPAVIFTSLLACGFGYFAISLLREQSEALRRNRTGIELLQGNCGEPRPLSETLLEVMGSPPSLLWLLPVQAR